MLNQSDKPMALASWLLIVSTIILALFGLVLGWNRGWNGQSSHTTSLAIILTVILIILTVITYFVSWRQSPDGARMFWTTILGIFVGLVIIVSIGMLILFIGAI
jgi:hypothetical protein